MAKFATGFIGLTLLIYSCSGKKELRTIPIKFTSFEIGYTNGWSRGFSFWVDSNKIFLSPQKFDLVKYGLLPDSIVRLVDTVLMKIIPDTAVKSTDDGCDDCSIVAMQTIIAKDTISLNQVGTINAVFWPVIRALKKFIGSDSHATIHAALILESQKRVFPPQFPLPSKKENYR